MKKILITMVFILSVNLPVLAQTGLNLPEAASQRVKELAVRFDFSNESCFPDAAFYSDGTQNPGLETLGCRDGEGDCRNIDQFNNSNTYHRSVCVGDYCVHMYAIYFQKDRSCLVEDHQHDIEYALVWTRRNEVTHGSIGWHGMVLTVSKDHIVLTDSINGDHLKIIYWHDVGGFITHALAFPPNYTEVDNPLGIYFSPTIVDWYYMMGDRNITNNVLRYRSNNPDLYYYYGIPSLHVNNINFPHEITKKIPWGYPPAEEWKAAVARDIESRKSYYRIVNRWNEDIPDNYIHIQDGEPEAGEIEEGWESAQWFLEDVDGTPYKRIRNRLKNNHYLHIENGGLESGPIQDGWGSAQWSVDFVSTGYYRIRNIWKNYQYLHIEHGELESGYIQFTWDSAQWSLDGVIGTSYTRIRNRWKDDQYNKYIHIKNDEPEAGEIKDELQSAQWVLEDVCDDCETYHRIQNEYNDNKYIYIQDGEPEAGEIDFGWLSAQWIFEPVEGSENYYRIRNRENEYLHIEGEANCVLQSGNIDFGWESTQWSIERIKDKGIPYKRIKNRYKCGLDKDLYLHMESGPLQIGTIEEQWFTARWILEYFDEGETYHRIRNRWKSNEYLHIEGSSQGGFTLKIGTIKEGESNAAQWILERRSREEGKQVMFYNIRNRVNDSDGQYQYLHMESGPLQIGTIEEQWFTAQWILEPFDNMYYTPNKGDIDGNSAVELNDAILALQIIVGIEIDGVHVGADVNADGKIGLPEVNYILQAVSGIRNADND